jgi:hypothetical protein
MRHEGTFKLLLYQVVLLIVIEEDFLRELDAEETDLSS